MYAKNITGTANQCNINKAVIENAININLGILSFTNLLFNFNDIIGILLTIK